MKITQTLFIVIMIFPLNGHSTMLYVNSISQKMYVKDSGWVYKYRLQITNPSSKNIRESVPHYISVRDKNGSEIPFASPSRNFFVTGTAPKVVDVYLKESEIDKKTIICAMSDFGGQSLGSCVFLPGLKAK